jgi:hypothetical protein
MTISEIPYDFIRQRVTIGWTEIKFGLDHQLLKPEGAIDKAMEQLCTSSETSKDLVELATMANSESVADLVSSLAGHELPAPDQFVKDKWLYIVLAWVYENQKLLIDPLQIVEEVYADFDYPQQIVSFVRYMPTEDLNVGNLEQNEARLFRSWRNYLSEMKDRFAEQTQ